MRELVKENILSLEDIIQPLFIVDGNNKKEPIKSMPFCYRYSIDNLLIKVKEVYNKGIKAVLLFPNIDKSLKSNDGREALNKDGLIQRAIKEIKNAVPEIVVITDVALDPYSIYGHDGIVKDNYVDNDETIEVLAKMALSHALAGVDMVSPSDMMDFRVSKIRESLEKNNFKNVSIMSYSAKYASYLYGPFRDALDSKPGFGDKKTYQLDFRNSKESIMRVKQDIEEGTDIVMVKPAIFYLDIIRNVRKEVNVPVSAYQVSGEYAMIMSYAQQNKIDFMQVAKESLVSIKRAGANIIITYFADKMADIINS